MNLGREAGAKGLFILKTNIGSGRLYIKIRTRITVLFCILVIRTKRRRIWLGTALQTRKVGGSRGPLALALNQPRNRNEYMGIFPGGIKEADAKRLTTIPPMYADCI